MEIPWFLVSVKEVYKAIISLQEVCIYICSWCMVHIYTSEKGERSLRCAKTMVEKEYHKLVPISCEGGHEILHLFDVQEPISQSQ